MDDMTNVYFLRAAIKGDLKEVEKQLNAGADINYNGESAYDTPLVEAAYRNHLKVVEFLILKGADVQHRNIDDDNALIKAVKGRSHKHKVKIIDLLFNNGLDNQNDLNKALYFAVKRDKEDVMKFLLGKGADVNAKIERSTPLHEAITSEKSTLKILLKANPDVNQKNDEGWTPMRLATERQLYSRIKILKKHGAHE